MADESAGRAVQNAIQNSSQVLDNGVALVNATLSNITAAVTNVTAVQEWGDLLVGPYNESQSDEWRREWVYQYRKRHENDPEVKYAVFIFYLIMVRPTLYSVS